MNEDNFDPAPRRKILVFYPSGGRARGARGRERRRRRAAGWRRWDRAFRLFGGVGLLPASCARPPFRLLIAVAQSLQRRLEVRRQALFGPQHDPLVGLGGIGSE